MSEQLTWRRVRWPVAGLGAARRHAGVREAVVVELRYEGGEVGIGEAAPLPGMSRDTIDDVVAELAAGAQRFWPGEVAALSPSALARCARQVLSPALEFALETASEPGSDSSAAAEVASAVVVDDDVAAAAAVASGAPALKLKLDAADDLARVRAISAAAPGVPLRIDANRTWPAAEVPERLSALVATGARIAWVEEPCRDTIALLDRGLALPIALDESLIDITPAQLDAALPRLAALVLKPTLLGPRRVRELAARARRNGVDAIISHALEGPIGYRACLALARELGGDVPHGLAPHPALAAAPHDPALSVSLASSPAPAIITATATLSHAACAEAAAAVTETATLVATPTLATLHAVHAALDAARPLALLHHRLPASELARQRELVARAQLPAGTAFVLFTSGSTGAPRGVVLSRAAISAAAAAAAAHLPWRDDDRWLLALSLAHAGGLAIVVRCLSARKPVVMLEGDFEAARCAALLRDQAVTIASFVPTQLAALLDDPSWRPPPSLRAVLLGGAATPRALVDAALARGVPVLETYGATESFGQVATARVPGGPLVALPGITLEAAAVHAEPSAIRLAGPTLATGYLDGAPIAPGLGGEAVAFATPDLGWYDPATRTLRVAGRRDAVIITGGENVHPDAVEAVLAATPGVRAAVAFGVADARWGQLVAAAIAVDARFDRDAAAAHWHRQLPPHARPRRLAIAAALPLLPTGKLDRRAASALPASAVTYADK